MKERVTIFFLLEERITVAESNSKKKAVKDTLEMNSAKLFRERALIVREERAIFQFRWYHVCITFVLVYLLNKDFFIVTVRTGKTEEG